MSAIPLLLGTRGEGCFCEAGNHFEPFPRLVLAETIGAVISFLA